MTSHLHRTTDPETSRLAAESIESKLKSRQIAVLEAFRLYGPMTDEELRQLPCFCDWRESTARGRRNELTMKPLELIKNSGEKRRNSGGNLQIVWKLKPKGTLF